MTQKRGGSAHQAVRETRPSVKGVRFDDSAVKKLEIVLKCDSFGSGEAVFGAIERIRVPGVKISVIHQGVGAISKSDLVMALTGSKLVVGFNVGLMPRLESWIKEHEVEVRLYDVIYKLTEDLETLTSGLHIPEPEERITARGGVLSRFLSPVPEGLSLESGSRRGISRSGETSGSSVLPGPFYTGRIESLHIRETAVNEAKTNQEVGTEGEGF